MREIKTRVYCKQDKKMYYSAYVEDHMQYAFLNELINAAARRYIIMLSAGIKDLRGVEIYDGDIIKCRISSYTKETHNAVVRFGEYKQDGSGGEYGPVTCIGFYADAINPKQLDDDGYRAIYDYDVTTSLLFFHSVEVVGNIYENPELLGGK